MSAPTPPCTMLTKVETGVIKRQAVFEKPSAVDDECRRIMFVENPPIRRVLAKVAKALGISVDDLLS